MLGVQVEEELQRAASTAHQVEEQRARLKVDQQRLEIQLGQAKEGKASSVRNLHITCLNPKLAF